MTDEQAQKVWDWFVAKFNPIEQNARVQMTKPKELEPISSIPPSCGGYCFIEGEHRLRIVQSDNERDTLSLMMGMFLTAMARTPVGESGLMAKTLPLEYTGDEKTSQWGSICNVLAQFCADEYLNEKAVLKETHNV